MGLDMLTYTTTQNPAAVDSEIPDDAAELFEWRKHPNLHGWMERLYRLKGGAAESFNCVSVQILEADLADLEIVVNHNRLPKTCGFFFGVSRPEYKARDLQFIEEARAALRSGRKVFYTSWW